MRNKVRILVVEDDMPLAMFMVHLLSRAGVDAQVAGSGGRGLELACEHKYDLILLDADSSKVDVFELFVELKQRHVSRRTPFILLSECPYVHPELELADRIQKPIVADDFVDRILAHVRRTEGLFVAAHI